MTRDMWRDICADMTRRYKRRIVLHCSTAIGEDSNGIVRRAGFTYRLSPVERAIRDAPRKGKYRRAARAFARLALAQSRSGGTARPADRLEEGSEVS